MLGFLLSLPVYAAVIAGVVVSWRKRDSHPRTALLSLIAFGILLFDQFLGGPLLRYLAAERSDLEYYLARSFLSLAFAGALVALLAAVFYERPPEDPLSADPRPQGRSQPGGAGAPSATPAEREPGG